MAELRVTLGEPDILPHSDEEWRRALSNKGQDSAARTTLLVKLLNTPLALSPEERLQAGDELAELGDPRAGVGLRADQLPDIDCVDIPDEGEFLYGTQESHKYVRLPAFKISRYPITYIQYQTFLDAPDGFNNTRWGEGLVVSDEHRRAPGDQAFKHANHPRDRVSWYDAIAFCRWMSDYLGYVVQLPTEWEWEKAARGCDGNIYPWGPEYISGYANIHETYDDSGSYYLKCTSPVGMYPQGESPYGVLVMSGNVWEWCLNEYENPKHINVRGNKTRVLRGGSWIYYSANARCARRFWYDPHLRDNGCGFRIVVSSSPHLI